MWLLLMTLSIGAQAQQQTASQKKAKQIFDKVYNEVFHGNGVSLSYHINIIGIYKTSGHIWYMGEKSKFVEKKSTVWADMMLTLPTVTCTLRSLPSTPRITITI